VAPVCYAPRVLPSFRRGAFALFAVVFVVTMLLGDRPVAAALELRPAELLVGRLWWTPLTALFRQPEGLGMLGLLWTLLVQWWLGSRLEGFWGTARYLTLVLVSGMVGMAGAAALGLVVPALRETTLVGAAPIDFAAVVAFGVVFANERLVVGKREISPVWVATLAGLVVLIFPSIVALVGGTNIAAAWPTMLPPAIAGLVAVVFVQPWRRRPKTGKVERAKHRGQPHLRVVRNADDMLNRHLA
jgi:membrane associated rhomboid family serine protease